MAVAVEVGHRDRRAALRHPRQRGRIPMKGAVAAVDVEAVLKSVVFSNEFITAAHHVQIRTTIAIGVEEFGVDVLVQAVTGERSLEARAEGSVALLNQQLARLP